MPDARLVVVGERDRVVLRQWAATCHGDRERRARIVLLAGQGMSNREIARRLGVSRPTVITWRQRYATAGLAGLSDRPRPGRPREVGVGEVVARTIAMRLGPRGATACARRVARELRVSPATVARAWRIALLRWDPDGGLEFATEPAMRAERVDIAGIYVHGACGVLTTTRQRGGYQNGLGTDRVETGRVSDRSVFGSAALRRFLVSFCDCDEPRAVCTPSAGVMRAALSSVTTPLSWHLAPSVGAWLNLVEALLHVGFRTNDTHAVTPAAHATVARMMNTIQTLATADGVSNDRFTWVNGAFADDATQREAVPW